MPQIVEVPHWDAYAGVDDRITSAYPHTRDAFHAISGVWGEMHPENWPTVPARATWEEFEVTAKREFDKLDNETLRGLLKHIHFRTPIGGVLFEMVAERDLLGIDKN